MTGKHGTQGTRSLQDKALACKRRKFKPNVRTNYCFNMQIPNCYGRDLPSTFQDRYVTFANLYEYSARIALAIVDIESSGFYDDIPLARHGCVVAPSEDVQRGIERHRCDLSCDGLLGQVRKT